MTNIQEAFEGMVRREVGGKLTLTKNDNNEYVVGRTQRRWVDFEAGAMYVLETYDIEKSGTIRGK